MRFDHSVGLEFKEIYMGDNGITYFLKNIFHITEKEKHRKRGPI